MQIPNAVELGGRVLFVTQPPGADGLAEQLGARTLCLMPPEYETLQLRRQLWQEQGLHLDDLTRDEVQEIGLCLALEREHPQRFKAKGA